MGGGGGCGGEGGGGVGGQGIEGYINLQPICSKQRYVLVLNKHIPGYFSFKN